MTSRLTPRVSLFFESGGKNKKKRERGGESYASLGFNVEDETQTKPQQRRERERERALSSTMLLLSTRLCAVAEIVSQLALYASYHVSGNE